MDAHSAQEKVIEVLNILQELGEGLGGSTDQDVHSLNQLQECAVQCPGTGGVRNQLADTSPTGEALGLSGGSSSI